MFHMMKWILGLTLVLALALSVQAADPAHPGLKTQLKKTPTVQPVPQVVAQKPDLVINSMVWSNPIREGDKVGMGSILNLVIANRGGTETPPTTVQFICTGGCPAGLSGSQSLPKILPGQNVGISWPNASSTAWPAGTFTLEAVADPMGQVEDSNKFNNRKKIVFTVVPALQKKVISDLQQTPVTTALQGTIQVNKPAAGEIWRIDTPQTFSWMVTGNMGAQVNIALWDTKTDASIRTVVNNALNSGSYTIPAGFFNGLPLTDYRLRVETTDRGAAGKSPVFKLAPPPLDLPAFSSIKVLQPAQNAQLQEGAKTTIRFETNMTGPYKFELLESPSQKKVMDLQVGAVQEQGANTFSVEWTVAEEDYNILTKYRIRASKGNIQGLSDSFKIQNVLHTTVYQIPVTTTVNKLSSRRHIYDKNSFTTAVPAEEPDPGPGRVRVGYLNYSDSQQYFNSIYRSWAFFDLNSLKGKGMVTKATLHFNLYAGSTSFIPTVKALDDRWNGEAGALFTVPGPAVSPTDLTSRVLDWVFKDQNYGLVFVGPNENLDAKGNAKAIGMYDNVRLVVEMTK